MAINQDIITPLKDALAKAEDILILLPENAGTEMVAAALSLSHVLKDQKGVSLACPTPLSQAGKSLPGSQTITQKIGNRNLVISLKLEKRDSVDKVSYNLDEESKVFNLIVQPKKGEKPLKRDQVSFSYQGAHADLIILVGAMRFEDLGSFYQDEKKLFTEAKTVSLTRYPLTPFADFHVSDQSSPSLCQTTYDFIRELELAITPDAATTLLAGLDSATNQLQSPNITAETFEMVATLMRQGGVRGSTPQSPLPQAQPQAQNGTPPVKAPTTPPPTGMPQPTIPPTSTDVPQEWLTPKIYKATDQSHNG